MWWRRACTCRCGSSACPSSARSTPRPRSSMAGRVMGIKCEVDLKHIYCGPHGWHSPVLAALGLAAFATVSCSFNARPAALCRHLQACGPVAPAARGWQPSPQSCMVVRRHAGVTSRPRSTGRPWSRTKPCRCIHQRYHCLSAAAPTSAPAP